MKLPPRNHGREEPGGGHPGQDEAERGQPQDGRHAHARGAAPIGQDA